MLLCLIVLLFGSVIVILCFGLCCFAFFQLYFMLLFFLFVVMGSVYNCPVFVFCIRICVVFGVMGVSIV